MFKTCIIITSMHKKDITKYTYLHLHLELPGLWYHIIHYQFTTRFKYNEIGIEEII